LYKLLTEIRFYEAQKIQNDIKYMR
jgi:hypothetical protein